MKPRTFYVHVILHYESILEKLNKTKLNKFKVPGSTYVRRATIKIVFTKVLNISSW